MCLSSGRRHLGGILDGQVINLLTDGNAQSLSVVFTVVVTPESIKADVQQLLGHAGLSPGTVTSLQQKLDNAAAQRAAGRCGPSGGMYQAFIDELSAKADKRISDGEAQVIIGDAQYLIAHCP